MKTQENIPVTAPDDVNDELVRVNFEAEAASPLGSGIIQLRPSDPEKEIIVDDPSGIRLHSPSRNRELLKNQNQFDKWGV